MISAFSLAPIGAEVWASDLTADAMELTLRAVSVGTYNNF